MTLESARSPVFVLLRIDCFHAWRLDYLAHKYGTHEMQD